ncbi:hypothetical protein V495_01371 [Pseudogymnoascus sp. VKM F-4514 (FW-929)]|nr:hypothetical protein V495_01371 [Pseudogymnoascus sp. VKM F-4514 (FW-929)]KFY66204.1 hypothetical protein V497_01046 [Pseudogymnoascus sp. VKM F-4516 (FW-969)]
MIGVQLPKRRIHKLWHGGDVRKPDRSVQGPALVRVPPWTTAEVMKATHQRRTAGGYETNCVVFARPHGAGAKPGRAVDTPLKDGKGGSEGVSVLSNLSPWIGLWSLVWALLWSTLLLSFGNTGISLYLLSENVPYGGESRTLLY